MKKIVKILGISLFSIFSFYYTNKMIELSKSKDPIMQEILENENKYSVSYVNAIIKDNYIIPGLNGLEVDVNSSYNKMKKVGKYNENLYIFINDLPKLSIKDNYDKFIISGNKSIKNISLIFPISNSKYLDEIINILNANKIEATFFIDGKWGEENIEILDKIKSNHYLANLGYEDKYDKETINYTNALIKRLTNENASYCYSSDMETYITEMCSKLNMYTIKPFITSTTSPFFSVKENIDNGAIFSLENNFYTVQELNTIINYIKQKGYNLVTINKLLSEER